MTYIYIDDIKDINQKTFVLLHGTGGNEHNLLQVAHFIQPEYNILAVRGDVDENGYLRFFKRKGEGNYDWADLEERGAKLLNFIKSYAEEKGLDVSKFIPLGFSNGANIAVDMLFREGQPFKEAVIMAPMYPTDNVRDIDLSGVRVFLSMGENDPICPPIESQRVIKHFADHNAEITEFWTNSHEVNAEVIQAARNFINQ